jgi:N-acetylglucosamine-6-phosphate deacetylase
MAREIYLGARLFTGERFLDGHGLLVEGGRIVAVLAEAEVPAEAERIGLGGGVLAPGFIDAQNNGGGGVLFNDEPEADALGRFAAAHARYGTTALLPTLVTDRLDVMAKAVEAGRAAIAQRVPGIVGLHLEGPFLSVARKGAHDPALIRPLTDADVDSLIESGLETLLVTVAAENAAPRQIRRLADGGIVVSLGHTDASYETAMAAADAGARGVTHLFNAMSQLQHRSPGVVGAALDHGGLWCGIIADGHHVHPAALTAALRAKKGPARLLLVTDAMPTAGHEGDVFHLNGRRVTRRNGVLTLDDGTLAGSDLTMDVALRYTVRQLGVALDEALRMASLYPAMFLGLDDRRGRLAPGYRADLVHLDDRLAVTRTVIGGQRVA